MITPCVWRFRPAPSLFSVAALCVCAGAAQGEPGRPINLRCEYQVNPLGIDTPAPRLSWHIQDERRGAMQTAYQILVSTDRTFDADRGQLFDTGMVQSDRSTQVEVKDLRLQSGRRYFWKVHTWDTDGLASEYSDTAWWEMGLLTPEDWKAKWVAAPAPDVQESKLAWGDWIWNAKSPPTNASAWFRLVINLDESARAALIKLTADNTFSLYVNGNKRGDGANWQVVNTYDIADQLRPGRNVIAIHSTNGDGPAGLLVAGRITVIGGKSIEFKSDPGWKTSIEAPEGWARPEFDDSKWDAAAVVTRYGGEPWKELKEGLGPRRSMCVRKDFKTKGRPVRARAHASALGLYELRLNGERVGGDILSPEWTHYPKRIQYQTYDVTDLLRDGENTVGAILGNGWWSGGLGWEGKEQYSEGPLRFILQLDLEYDDGSRETVITDPSWRSAPSPITRDTLYHGETYDATLEVPGWDAPGFKGDAWQPVSPVVEAMGRLVAQACESIQVTQDLPALQMTEVDKGVFIADFGQNAAGRVRLKVNGPKGTRIRLRFAEVLTPEGRLYRDNYRTAEATDVYILRGAGQEVWEPRFTYRGFRYCEITGYPGVPGQDAVTARVLHTAAAPAGTFECSNWLLNQIHSAIVWGQRSNLHSVPTDCPQRDERLGWMGDAQAFAPTACWNMQMGAFFEKWMHDVSDSRAQDGSVTDVAPVIVVKGPAAPGWGDAAVVVPWTIYQFYGDERIITDNYDTMVGWVEYMRRNSKDHLYEREGYGDWVATVVSPKKPIGAAYYYHSTNLLAKMAAVIGKSEDAAKYTELASQIAGAFNAKYLDPQTDSYTGGTQTANLLPLAFGITPEDQREAVLENVLRDIRARDYHLSTGFLGTPCLMPVLADGGRQELAYRLATQTTFPSWGYMIRNGATTIWELWDTDKRGPSMNSRNHFALGVVGQWFWEDLAGINIDPQQPGFKHVIIRPRPAGDLQWARAEYASPYGTVRSEWRRREGILRLSVTIPANSTAQVWVPTLGQEGVTISEAETVLLRRARRAGTVEGVQFSRMEHEHAVFDVGAGEYAFTVNRGS